MPDIRTWEKKDAHGELCAKGDVPPESKSLTS
jgi:hypothetical protein